MTAPTARHIIKFGNLIAEIGQSVFVTTAESEEVNTTLSKCLAGFATPSASSNANDILEVDNTITSGAITVGRPASGTSALTFNYIFIGLP